MARTQYYHRHCNRTITIIDSLERYTSLATAQQILEATTFQFLLDSPSSRFAYCQLVITWYLTNRVVEPPLLMGDSETVTRWLIMICNLIKNAQITKSETSSNPSKSQPMDVSPASNIGTFCGWMRPLVNGVANLLAPPLCLCVFPWEFSLTMKYSTEIPTCQSAFDWRSSLSQLIVNLELLLLL